MNAKQHPPAESVEEALRNAAHHARNAVAELVAAARAILDAVSLVANRNAAAQNPTLASIARLLDELESHIASPTRGAKAAEPILRALSGALEGEIRRWEQRAEQDADARAVLRAFLGLREVLWELGVRPARTSPPGAPRQARAPRRQATRSADVAAAPPAARPVEPAPRVQRVRVQG